MRTKVQVLSIRGNIKKIAGKRILLRCDYNVPIKGGEILDDFRIVASLPTLRFLLRYKCKLILCTHLGQPKEKDLKYTTRPIANYLGKVLNQKIYFSEDCVGAKAKLASARLKSGEILMLENLRFHKEEEKNDKKFARSLAALADVYVNNAFGASHRSHASMAAIKKYLSSFAGLLIEKEINNLEKVNKPNKPLISIIGGAKIETKIKLIIKLIKKSERILIGGALANNFFVAHGLNVGKSLVDKESIKFAKKFKNKNIILPIDVVVAKNDDYIDKPIVRKIQDIKSDEMILDIGPKTIQIYTAYIKKANTIIWNGPMGMFEKKPYKHGTLVVGQAIASRSRGHAFGAVGGGETIEALKMTKMLDYVDWVSTGGGAMLSYLGGEKMPGLKGIVKNLYII